MTNDQFRSLITSNQRSQTVLVKGCTEAPATHIEKQNYLTDDTTAPLIYNFRKGK